MPRVVKKTETTKSKRTSSGKASPTIPSRGKNGKAKTKLAPAEDALYPTVSVKLCDGDSAISQEDAKKLLGWEEETDDIKFGSDYVLVDENGNKIRCHHNVNNRPLYLGNVAALKQEHLRKRWRLNGEPIIIGRNGKILNGQHTLIAFILACQEWVNDRERWSEWEKEPTLSKVVVFGIDESDDTVNTLDTCKPRSLADVIYRSEYFAGASAKDRKILARICAYSIKVLWDRTGVSASAYAPGRMTHSEALDFIARHPRLLECVNHVYEENDENRISKNLNRLGIGYIAGLLYLMGCSATDPVEYIGSDRRDESSLDWEHWDKACEFFVLIAGRDSEVEPLRTSLAKMIDSEDGVSIPEKTALLINSWNLFVQDEQITANAIALNYVTDEDGFRQLVDHPTVGGIDVADPDDVVIEPDDPEEVEKAKKNVKAERVKKSAGKNSDGRDPEIGDTVWVVEKGEDPWSGELIEIYDGPKAKGKIGRVTVAVGHPGAGQTYESPLSRIRLDQPIPA